MGCLPRGELRAGHLPSDAEARTSSPKLPVGRFRVGDPSSEAQGWVESWTPAPTPTRGRPVPVFLIGFPRSGTTLLDQILDSHPMLSTMEEKDAVDQVRCLDDRGRGQSG